jgi:hypothetical protein
LNDRGKLALALALVLVAACAVPLPPPSTGQARADAQTAAACRQRADAVYNERHRDTIYAAPPEVDTPFSGAYAPGEEDRQLSNVFERDSMLSDCERNTGAEGNRTPDHGAPPASPVPGPLAPGPVARP